VSEQQFPNSRNAQYEEDEIDLLELWRTLLKHKRLIIKNSFIAAFIVAAISLLIPNVYRADVLLAPVQAEDVKAGGLASALGSLGGLASMAGISLGSGGSTEENLAVLQSKEFLWRFVQEEKLASVLFEPGLLDNLLGAEPPGQWDVYRLFIEDKTLEVVINEETGLIAVAIQWSDPALAANWANTLVAKLNRYLAQQAIDRSTENLKYLNEELMRTQVEEMRKTLYDLIAAEQQKAMLANTQKDFAFKVIDRAVEPDKKVKPKRTIMVILAFMLAVFFSVVYVLFREGIAKRNTREEPQA
jgi:uncharacterized protein involved in exopolysaccharide biosynthesis